MKLYVKSCECSLIKQLRTCFLPEIAELRKYSSFYMHKKNRKLRRTHVGSLSSSIANLSFWHPLEIADYLCTELLGAVGLFAQFPYLGITTDFCAWLPPSPRASHLGLVTVQAYTQVYASTGRHCNLNSVQPFLTCYLLFCWSLFFSVQQNIYLLSPKCICIICHVDDVSYVSSYCLDHLSSS